MIGLRRMVATSVGVVPVILSLLAGPSMADESRSRPASGPTQPVLAQAETPSGPSAGPTEPRELPPGGGAIEDLLLQKGAITMDEWIQIRAEQEYRAAEQARRIDAIEDWKNKTELLPILRDKVNFGLNALQFLYSHQDAEVPEGKSKDNFSIRRFEILFWGKISETIPRWHALVELQSINFGKETPTGGSGAATGQPVAATFFRESYIDFRPFQSWAPNLNFFRFGIFRMPFGIFTETSGGLRDVIKIGRAHV